MLPVQSSSASLFQRSTILDALGRICFACLLIFISVLLLSGCVFFRASDLNDEIERGNEAEALAIIEKGKSINSGRPFKGSPVHVAAAQGSTKLIDALIKHNADVNLKTDAGTTALSVALAYGQDEIAIQLLAAGADPSISSKRGYTPLHYAARASSDIELVQRLITAKNINFQTDWGDTPLHLATEAGREDMALLLLDSGADPMLLNDYQESPLHFAAARGMVQFLAAVDEKILSTGVANYSGATLLHAAILSGEKSVVANLVAAGSPNIPDAYGDYPIHWAASLGHTEIARLLSECEPSHAPNSAGMTPSLLAAQNDHPQMLDIFGPRPAECLTTGDNALASIKLANYLGATDEDKIHELYITAAALYMAEIKMLKSSVTKLRTKEFISNTIGSAIGAALVQTVSSLRTSAQNSVYADAMALSATSRVNGSYSTYLSIRNSYNHILTNNYDHSVALADYKSSDPPKVLGLLEQKSITRLKLQELEPYVDEAEAMEVQFRVIPKIEPEQVNQSICSRFIPNSIKAKRSSFNSQEDFIERPVASFLYEPPSLADFTQDDDTRDMANLLAEIYVAQCRTWHGWK